MLWRFYKSISAHRKGCLKGRKAQEVRAGSNQLERQRSKSKFRNEFKEYKRQAYQTTWKSSKRAGVKIPYKFIMKACTHNVRGLNGENGITKRELIVKRMKEEKIDIMLLTETNVNTNSVEDKGNFIFFFSTSVDPKIRESAEERRAQGKGNGKGKDALVLTDKETAGVGIVIAKRLVHSCLM